MMSQSTPKKSREISCKNFFFTVSNVEKDSFTSGQLFSAFEELCELLIVEKDISNELSDSFNTLLTTKNGQRKDRLFVEQVVFELFGSNVCITYLQFKHLSTVIKSFSDEFLVFKGCQINEFNDGIKRKLYARNIDGNKIDILDPFIQSNSGQLSFIERTVEAIRNPAPIVNRLFPLKYQLDSNGQEKKFGNWRDEVVEYLNGWIINGWHHKRKHLCLYGKSNVGKSTFCNALLGNYDHQNFPIGINDSKFAFDRWDPKQYTHCIIHEFDFTKIESSTWKVALEGLTFKINRKHRTGIDGAIQVPFIFITNEDPSSFIDPALTNRIQFVKCISSINDKINDISDYLRVDHNFTEHKLTPVVQKFFPSGSIKFPTEYYNRDMNVSVPIIKHNIISHSADKSNSLSDDFDTGYSDNCSTPISTINEDDVEILNNLDDSRLLNLNPKVLIKKLNTDDFIYSDSNRVSSKRLFNGVEKLNEMSIIKQQDKTKIISAVKSSITISKMNIINRSIVSYSDSEDSNDSILSLNILEEIRFVVENIKKRFENWRDLVVDWYNENTTKKIFTSLFLYGESNTGKTSYIHSVFGCYKCQWFIPSLSDKDFAFSGLDASVHKFIVFDNFDIKNFNQKEIQSILTRKSIFIKRRYRKSKMMVFFCPIIMISNTEPPDCIKNDLFVVKSSYDGMQNNFEVENFISYEA
ncbi:hypothetical protein BpHYR1_050355 [Brachionus plicatilis]|uniref:SF3 helicase domain-containing protein n=1 Tax=Brachionus plicatilis TaxID=10195 RepID=A0A3M7P4Z1_BRAPC|nr:hypothetical protein BpHYR1_050355 [Brachionus plicatilis]